MKHAVIIGCDGQDGTILTGILHARGYAVTGVGRPGRHGQSDVDRLCLDITDAPAVRDAIGELRPDEIYHLAAHHHASEDRCRGDLDLFTASYKVNLFSLLNILETVATVSPSTRVFYASSSRIFGEAGGLKQDEITPFAPDTAYGITKLDGLLACRYYRASREVFASTGILFNHESRYRRGTFISRKIAAAAVRIKGGDARKLVVGDLDAEVDWGFAPDYADAMHRILQLERPDEFVVATGDVHSVRELASIAFGHLGLDWRDHVVEDRSLIATRRGAQSGNPEKLRRFTGWTPSVTFEEMVTRMVDEEMEASDGF